jgi:PAS domain S-box-containing protein
LSCPGLRRATSSSCAGLAMRDHRDETLSAPGIGSEHIDALLRAIVDSSDDAIVSKTLDGIITSWNPAAERMFGYTMAEAVGQSIRLIVPPELQTEEDFVLAQIRCGEKVDHFETIRQTKYGRRLNISLTVSPIKNAHGLVVGASKIARDITEKKQLERIREELLAREKAAREELTEALKARDEFIAVAAHELRNPLNVFVLILQLLHEASADPLHSAQVPKLIERSRIQVSRLATLIDRLMDVTRARTGKLELYRETFDLSGVIKDVAVRFTNEDSSTPISLELEPAIGTWDRIRIDQVATNLISNAIKYGQQKAVLVSASARGGEAKIIVRDSGIGISRDDLDRIFDRFERGTQRSRNESLGLGLWITKQIVEAHGGTISAESELGKGSVFMVRLPLTAVTEKL